VQHGAVGLVADGAQHLALFGLRRSASSASAWSLWVASTTSSKRSLPCVGVTHAQLPCAGRRGAPDSHRVCQPAVVDAFQDRSTYWRAPPAPSTTAAGR
jgi:hypothetical protein